MKGVRFGLVSLRELLVSAGPFVLLSLAALALAYWWLDPTPPRRVTLATGPAQSAYAAFGERYKKALAAYGIEVVLLTSEGSSANLRLLRDGKADLGFVQGGTGSSADDQDSGILSLGSLFVEPVWLFYRTPASTAATTAAKPSKPAAATSANLPLMTLDALSQLAGLRVNLDTEGSGVPNLMAKLLEANRVEAGALKIFHLAQTPATVAFLDKELDAIVFASAPESLMVQMLLQTPGVSLMDFAQSEAYARRFPFLSPVLLPQGVVDLAANVPPKDVRLVASTTSLLARDGTHPALLQLFADAARSLHGGAGWFNRAGEFPNPRNAEFPLAKEAERTMREGTPLMQRYLPFWLANLVERMWLALGLIIAILLPLSRIVPPLYAFRIRSRVFRWYGRLRAIEDRMDAEPAATPALAAELDELETRVGAVNVPLSYADELYALRNHIGLVRGKLQQRAGGLGHAGETGRATLLVLAALALLATLLVAGMHQWAAKPGRLLLAPMIGGLNPCFFPATDDPKNAYAQACMADHGSAAPLIESTLQQLASAGNAPDRGNAPELGYSLPVPLLRFLKRRDDGGWAVDRSAIERVVRTIRDEDRPLVLHLFSNHFGVGAEAEQELAKDPANMLQTRAGPLGRDSYYGIDIYPWSFARTDNTITRLREQVASALLDEICKLPAAVQQRIRAVTVLGELHHMFPKYETGMGFAGPYLISDYSPASATGFRLFLAAKFGAIGRLNALLGSRFASFDEVQPPSRDIRSDPGTRPWEQIDAYAHGLLQVSGWTFAPGHSARDPAWIRIYRNGELVGRAAANYSRQDVAAVFPQFGTADVGWSYELDFSRWPAGAYRIDVLLERGNAAPLLLATRQISVLGPAATTAPVRPLPPTLAPPAAVRYHVDAPAEGASYAFNPLAPLWHQFRQSQVRDYLAHFRAVVAHSCVPSERIYSHQILPDVNPGWDVTKFAIGPDLSVPADMQLGVSLYGEASYGRSFVGRLDVLHRDQYGITEFHPLKPMDAPRLATVLRQHSAHGAQFLSFFMDAKGLADSDPQALNFLAFNPRNPKFGSDVLFESARQILR